MALNAFVLGAAFVLVAGCDGSSAVTPTAQAPAASASGTPVAPVTAGPAQPHAATVSSIGTATPATPAAAAPPVAGAPATPTAGAPAADGGKVAIAGSSAPTPAQEPRPEPTGVVFDWPETTPGSGGGPPCKAGRYVGEYKCRLFIIATEGDGAFDVSGTLDMRLEQTAQGELLRVANGKFLSATLAAIPMTADIVGELACSRSRFEGRLENGKFSVALGLPLPFTEGTFAGELNSDFDHATAALNNGTWDMMGELDLVPGSCKNGSWSARWVE